MGAKLKHPVRDGSRYSLLFIRLVLPQYSIKLAPYVHFAE
jgi:hypothetical protein